MSTERPYWKPGPPPAPDGLHDAFRRAHRRRMRTAATSSLPVLVGAVVLATVPLAGGGATSLDTDPAGVPTASATSVAGSRTVAQAHLDAATVGTSEGTTGRSPNAFSDGTGGSHGADDPNASPLPTIPPTLGPPTREITYLDVSATGTKRTHIDLTEPVRVDATGTTFTTSGAYAGVYLVSDDGATRGGVFRTPVPDSEESDGGKAVVGTLDTLPAGGYTVYVVGTGAVRVQVPLFSERPAITVTASDPATAYAGHAEHTFGTGDVEADVRLPVTGGATSVGLAGATLYGTSKTNAEITACLSQRDTACGPDDPHGTGGATLSVTGTEGARVAIEEGDLGTDRDLVAHASVTTATDTTLWAWFIVLDL